ncbi:MAG: murein DD-endopeptidase MepM/ murein hydrolase activator NlpD [Paracoccaceae bacterium]|jgi:murein DD-endopeptidase MepM/ murein hydrolase activator NlpD
MLEVSEPSLTIMDRNTFAFSRFSVVIGLMLVLAACGQRIGSAPVVNGATGERIGNTSNSANLPSTIRVQRGDSLYKISRRYNVRLRAIIDANNLKPPYTIFPGQKLRMPVTGVHTVSRGETVYQIAQRYGVEPGALVRVNRISPPYRLSTGQRLVLPAGAAAASKSAATRQPASRAVSTSPRRPNTTINRKPVPQTATRSTTTRPQPRKVLPAERVVVKRAPPTSASVRPPPPSTGGFVWPVSGKLLSRFGTLGKGLQNDGINILARRGTPVRSIQSGVVAYSGNELRGFGNLLLIKHAGGWISAYAHNDRLLVKTGQRVRRGQVISHVGSTGSVDKPQLHFELRRQNRAVDPERYLGRRTARLSR